MDGIRRRRLADKRSGIFECANILNDPLAAGLPNQFAVPHSRFNDLDQSELTAGGYTVFSTSERAGVDTFTKKSRGTFVFFQGHLEYETDTLFREYRRDVGRFLKGEREEYPSMPERYFPSEVQTRLLAFRERALADRREALLADFPSAKDALSNTWRAPATHIYRNWLGTLSAEKKWRAGRTATNQPRKSVHSQPASRPSRLHAAESGRLARVGFSSAAPRVVKRASEPGSAT
jgi:homoserine O-succinyltransferase